MRQQSARSSNNTLRRSLWWTFSGLLLTSIEPASAANEGARHPPLLNDVPGLRHVVTPGDSRPSLLLAQTAATGEIGQPAARGEDPPRLFDGQFDMENEVEVLTNKVENISLVRREPRDNLRSSEQELQLQARYRSGQWLSALGEIKIIHEQAGYTDVRQDQHESMLERGEIWAHFARLFASDFSLRIGRQNFVEPRRWWWDDDLDAVRLYYSRDPLRFYAGVAEELGRKSSGDKFIDPEQDKVRRFIGHANWRLAEGLTLGTFYLAQRDRSSRHAVDAVIETEREDLSDANLRWFGLRASGETTLASGDILSYWADTAEVNGDETTFEYLEQTPSSSLVNTRSTRRVRGRAIDLGVAWAPLMWRNPTLTISHARGTGDQNQNDGIDSNYRQTGLQDQDEEFRNYGELLRPELSNLSIFATTFGFSVHTRTRVTLGYHRFRQLHPAPFLRSARIESNPNGVDKRIGSETSLLIEIREWKNIQIDLVAATFTAGRAFGDEAGCQARSTFAKLTYKF